MNTNLINANSNIQKNNKIKKAWGFFFALAFFCLGIFFLDDILSMAATSTTDQVQLSVEVNGVISLDCGSDVDLGTLTPGTPVSSSTTCTVTTSADDGYDLEVKRDDANSTMDKTDEAATDIADKTAWDPTAGSGAGNAATWSGTGLGFSVYASTATKSTTWWGSGSSCHDASNKYAGFPAAYALVMDHDSYSSSSTTTSVCYRLDVPSTQKSGSYDGTITYQATTKP